MIVMLAFRALEIKIGRDIIPRNFREAFDELIFDIYEIFLKWFSVKRKKILNNIKKFFVYVLHLLIGFWGFALRKTLKIVSIVQGRIDGSVKGYVQEHLKAVESYKNNKPL